MSRYVCWLNPNFKMKTLVLSTLLKKESKTNNKKEKRKILYIYIYINRKSKQNKNKQNNMYLCLPVKSLFVVKDLNHMFRSHCHLLLFCCGGGFSCCCFNLFGRDNVPKPSLSVWSRNTYSVLFFLSKITFLAALSPIRGGCRNLQKNVKICSRCNVDL